MQDPCHLAFRENQFFPQRLEYFLNRQYIPVCKSYPIKVSVLFAIAQIRHQHRFTLMFSLRGPFFGNAEQFAVQIIFCVL